MNRSDLKTQTQLLKKLIRRIRATQHKRSRSFLCIGFFEKLQGLFASHSTYNVYTLRRFLNRSFAVRASDNNSFVSFWTVNLLLEAFDGDAAPVVAVPIRDAVKALMAFHDRTRADDDPLFVFWKQHELGGSWVSYPSNLMPFYRLFALTHAIQEKLKGLFSKPRPSRQAGGPSHEPARSSAAINIPADFDDSALNWELGAALAEQRDAYPEAWAAWNAREFDFEKLARHAVACAYRPFSGNPNTSAIDPRTFYGLREFLWGLADSGQAVPEFSLVTTWASTLQDNLEWMQRYYKMPFNVNNVDYSVSANFIHAAMKNAFSDSFPHDVAGLRSLVTDTASLLAWGITSGAVMDRPDLLLLYYPSPYLAFFFVSRTVHLLENARALSPLPELQREVRQILSGAAREKITCSLLDSARHKAQLAFWDGTGLEAGMRFSLRAPNTHDDRLFITAVSVGTLMNLWAVRSDGALRWLENTPGEVPALAEKAMRWLRRYALRNRHPDHNAFFSSSVKFYNSLPFLFPANRVEHVEGPVLPTRLPGKKAVRRRQSIYAMAGVPSRQDYLRALEEKGLGEVNSDAFKKCYELAFPYWSAPSVTYAMICLVLTRGEALGL